MSEAWEVFETDYLSAVLELCSPRLSLYFLSPKAATGDHHRLAYSLFSLQFSRKQQFPLLMYFYCLLGCYLT